MNHKTMTLGECRPPSIKAICRVRVGTVEAQWLARFNGDLIQRCIYGDIFM